MTDLRAIARDRPCMVRIEGCTGGGETTVLAHARIIGLSGMGYKIPDALGAWSCASCHRRADTDRTCELDFLRGVLRTQAALISEGILKW